MNNQGLPSFEHPPLVETIFGIDFEGLEDASNAHLGTYWAQISNEWPKVNDAPPIKSQAAPRTSWLDLSMKIQFSQDVASRLQARSADQSRMIQLQKNLFRYNWLKKTDEDYPRYSSIKPEVQKEFRRFANFAQSELERELTPHRWEVVYINHIPKETLWDNHSEWSSIFSFELIPGKPFSHPLTSFNCEWNCEISDNEGWLNVQISHGKLADSEILRLILTAWGGGGSFEEIEAGLDLGRQTIVTSFDQLTSKKAHKFWGKR